MKKKIKKKIWITIGIIVIIIETFCYFYAANNVFYAANNVKKEKNELQPGTTIVIPEVSNNSSKTEAN